MFDNLRNMAGLMSQAGQIRERIEQVQAELARRQVQAESGAGAVRVTMNGRFEVLRVQIDPHMIQTLAGSGSDADREMIEELLASAFNAAHVMAQDLIKEEMRKATGGLNIPGLDQMLQG